MSTLLEQASLVMIPSGYKEDVVYSVIPQSGAGDLSFTRASNGTRVNSAGLVEVCPWNLAQQSNTFNTTWASGGPGGTVTSGQTDPNGGSNAWLLSKLGQTGRIEQTINVGGVQTFFIYAKKNTSDFILINIFDGTTSHECWFNLSTGAVGTQNSSTGAIESVGNGWYKCSVTSTNLIASGIIQLYQSEANGVVSGTTGSIYIWGAQINVGSTAKPYFPTTDRLNVPRLTYQNGGGGCPSLLLEKQSTNLVPYSEDFSQWYDAGGSVSTNTTISPDGTQNADTLTGARYQVGLGTGIFTFSCYAKKLNGDNIFQLRLDVPATISAVYNLDTGTIVSTPSGYSATITAVGNGWYRCTLTNNSSLTITNAVIISANAGSNSTYVWGAQCEVSSYPTSYIPTTSSSATRVADACFKTGISSLIGQTSGAVYGDFELMPITDEQQVFYMRGTGGVYDNTFSLYVFKSGGNYNLAATSSVSNVLQMNLSKNNISVGRHKVAFAYANNDFVLYVDGVQAGTQSSGSVAACSQIRIGNYDDGGVREGLINETILFPTRLTNSELAQLTGNQNYTINQAYASYGVASESPNCVQP